VMMAQLAVIDDAPCKCQLFHQFELYKLRCEIAIQ
jgi:hypothetical protein